MPAKSAKQKRLMDAAAHNPAFAKKVGIPTKVAKEFSAASKGQKFRKGGDAMAKCGTKKMASGGLATRGEGIAKKGFADGGMAQSQGKVLSQQVKKTVPGDKVNVRGVGAARARTATIY